MGGWVFIFNHLSDGDPICPHEGHRLLQGRRVTVHLVPGLGDASSDHQAESPDVDGGGGGGGGVMGGGAVTFPYIRVKHNSFSKRK